LIFEYWSELLVLVILTVLMYRRPLLSLTNIMNFYWVSMVIIGLLLYPLSSQFVKYIDDDLLRDSVRLYVIGFAFFSLGIYQFRMLKFLFGNTKIYTPLTFSTDKIKIKSFMPWALGIFSGVLLFITFYNVGYIPFFEGNMHVTKYFQDDLDVYTKFRPLYTFALNALSTVLVFSLAVLFQTEKKKKWIILSAVIIAMLLLSAKRGPLLIPFIYVGLSYSIMKRSIKPLIYNALLVIVVGIAMNLAVAGGRELMSSFLVTLSTSGFVGVRELTRLLTIDAGELLYGKTYIAGFLSFIPTEWFEFKAQYNYMRYVMNLEGVDPSLSGGMRACYLGEALINFGMLGILLVSYLFGLVLSVLDFWFLRSKWIERHGLIGLVLGVMIFHLGIIAFFENGSAATLFFLNRTIILWLLIIICFPRKQTNLNSN